MASHEQCENALADERQKAAVMGLLEVAGHPSQSLDDTALLELCKQMPANLLECGLRLDFDSRSCKKDFEAFARLVDSTPAAEGPQPDWVLELAEPTYRGLMLRDGSLAIKQADRVHVYRNGKPVWTSSAIGDDLRSDLAEAGECILAGAGNSVLCLSTSDGSELWRVELPEDEAEVKQIEVGAGSTRVLDTHGAVWSVAVETCPDPSCVQSTTVESTTAADFFRAENDFWLVADPWLIKLMNPDNSVLHEFDAGESKTGLPRVSENGVWFDVDDALIHLNPKACASSEDTCERVVATHHDLVGFAPLPLPWGGMVVGGDYGVVFSIDKARPGWVADVGNDGEVMLVGDTVISIGHNIAIGKTDQVLLRGLDPKTGRTLWLSQLPGQTSIVERPLFLAVDDTTVVISNPTSKHVMGLTLPVSESVR